LNGSKQHPRIGSDNIAVNNAKSISAWELIPKVIWKYSRTIDGIGNNNSQGDLISAVVNKSSQISLHAPEGEGEVQGIYGLGHAKN